MLSYEEQRREQRRETIAAMEMIRKDIMEEADLTLRIIQDWLYEERILNGQEEIHSLRQWLATPLKQGRLTWNGAAEFTPVLEAVGKLSVVRNRLWMQGALLELTRIREEMMWCS
jgi:hypothetical protein